MPLQILVFTLGIILTIAGVTKRKTVQGKWMLASGVAILLAGILIAGYGDIKAGFWDALND